ncbi:MAG TPA: 3-isopropylmalate dehydratase small subunit [Thermodesulfobacteriota bacterium]|nr:3-isopropylmalate dehydratase small subunit [Thermodesulfobacteriota bacterium]
MEKTARGKVFIFGANIDTDQIYPGRYLELTDPKEVGKHALEGADPSLVKEFKAGDIIVASTNFGCGSSREQAAITLKAIGVGAILADSFARIFYRNAINLGIPLLVCPGIHGMVKKGDTVSVNLITGDVVNETSGAKAKAQPLSDYVMKILESGGIKPMIRKQIGADA